MSGCWCCGEYGHIARHCPRKNSKCYKCGKIGHLRNVCKGVPETVTIAPTIPPITMFGSSSSATMFGSSSSAGISACTPQESTEPGKGFSCCICYDEFDTPKVLSCGHTFCVQCIENVVDRIGEPKLRCPTCRQDVDFPESGKTEDLSTNYQLLSVISGKKKRKVTETPDGPHENCKVHEEPNKLYCQSCKEPICFNCTLREHEVGKHIIITKKEFVEEKRRDVYKVVLQIPDVRQTFDHMKEEFEQQRARYDREKNDLETAVETAIEEKQKQLTEQSAELRRLLVQSLNEPDTKNDHFRDQLLLQENVLEKSETQTRDFLKALDNRNFVDGGKITEVSKDLTKIAGNLEKMKGDFQELPANMKLNFEPATHEVRIGSLVS